MGIADTLSYNGRFIVIKSTVTAIPNFAMCTLKLPLGFLDYVEGATRGFLWIGKDIHKKGLGVLNPRTHNISLLIKNLFKFMNMNDIPWVKLIWQAYYGNNKIPQNCDPCGSIWWMACLKLLNSFLELATCSIDDGATVRLWSDKWCDDTLRIKFLHHCSFARDQNISLRKAIDFCSNDEAYIMFHLPLSMIASQQYYQLIATLEERIGNSDIDAWHMATNKSPYSCKRVYMLLFHQTNLPLPQ